MSRIHRRDARGDWALEVKRDYPYWRYSHPPSSPFAPLPRYLLSVQVTRGQMQQLPGSPGWERRGCPSWEYGYRPGYGYSRDELLTVKDIEVTEEEANRIANGVHPLDVLLPAWPECGYRLVAVPDPLAGGAW
jgi:hypothetical protein